MKDSTRKTIDYLLTEEGKQNYRERLAYHQSGEDPSELIWDRFPGYALQDIANRFGGHEFDDDWVLGYCFDTKKTGMYGEPYRSSKLPAIIYRCKKSESLAKHLEPILESEAY